MRSGFHNQPHCAAREEIDMTDVRDLNKQESQALALRLGDRMKRWKEKMDEAAVRTTRLLVATGTGFGVGIYMGGLEYDRQALIDEGKLTDKGETPEGGTDTDPTKFYQMDKDLLIGLGLTAAALVNVGGKKMAPMVSSAALGTLAGWASARGRQMGMDRAREAAAASP